MAKAALEWRQLYIFVMKSWSVSSKFWAESESETKE